MLDKNVFFEQYKVEREFINSDLDWDTLEEIYDDFCGKKEYFKTCTRDLERYLRDNIHIPIHSVRCRMKDPDHLIEKIIRKRGIEQNAKYKGINKGNYQQIVRDLVGVRILIFSKEEWRGVFDSLSQLFASSQEENPQHFQAESPVAYTRYGDRNIFGDRPIKVDHTNKGYRSQHYVVCFQGCYCEIQVRTLTEEVYGEFDHKVKYPYRNDNKFLIRYTSTLSQLLGSVDELISTCFQMKPEGWEQCSQYYNGDQYIDWMNISKEVKPRDRIRDRNVIKDAAGKIDASTYAKHIILRKD